MSIYDKIKSPIESDENLIKLINIYANLKGKNQLNKMYSYVTKSDSTISEQEMQVYEDKFFSYIAEPSATKMAQDFKNGSYVRSDDTFMHLYTEEDMQIMFSERSASEIIRRGREIESRNAQVFKKVDPIFWKYGEVERKSIYPQFLRQNGIDLNDAELRDWIDYRAVMEEFQNPRAMGFHLDRNLKDDKMKLYVNAGVDTYELASMFSTISEEHGIEPNFKVVSGNVESEVNRKDRLCIYIDDLNLMSKYIEILEKIKSERPDFKMEKPMPTVGNIDNWIGIGTDSVEGSSYNKDISTIVTEVCNRYFSNIDQNTINEFIKLNPQVLDTIRQDMKKMCIEQGKSAEKICIQSADEEKLKGMTIRDDKQSNVKVDQYAKSITTENINAEKMQYLYENGYTGTFDNPVLNMTYQMYCESRKKDEQIQELETRAMRQEEVIKYDSEIINKMGNKYSILCSFVRETKETLRGIGEKITILGNGTRGLKERLVKDESKGVFSKFISKIKSKFSKTPMLPAAKQCENIELDNIDLSTNVSQWTAVMQRRDENNVAEINGMNEMVERRKQMVMGINSRAQSEMITTKSNQQMGQNVGNGR